MRKSSKASSASPAGEVEPNLTREWNKLEVGERVSNAASTHLRSSDNSTFIEAFLGAARFRKA
jgi:hypothetical protein